MHNRGEIPFPYLFIRNFPLAAIYADIVGDNPVARFCIVFGYLFDRFIFAGYRVCNGIGNGIAIDCVNIFW